MQRKLNCQKVVFVAITAPMGVYTGVLTIGIAMEGNIAAGIEPIIIQEKDRAV